MNQSKTFLFALTVSACFTFANRLVIGSGGPDVRPLAKSLGAATINECKVMGRIESRPQGVYAVFDFENPADTEKGIAFNYMASRTAPMSRFSRMGPRPETVKKGSLECRAKAGHTTEEVLLKEAAPASSEPAKPEAGAGILATGVVARMEKEMTPEIWTLVVSREEIKGIHGWGAVGPAPTEAAISLDKGEAVLAVTVPEKVKP